MKVNQPDDILSKWQDIFTCLDYALTQVFLLDLHCRCFVGFERRKQILFLAKRFPSEKNWM